MGSKGGINNNKVCPCFPLNFFFAKDIHSCVGLFAILCTALWTGVFVRR